MSAWTADELSNIGAAHELELATVKRDGSLRKPVTVWVVRVDDDLYVVASTKTSSSSRPRTTATIRSTPRTAPSTDIPPPSLSR